MRQFKRRWSFIAVICLTMVMAVTPVQAGLQEAESIATDDLENVVESENETEEEADNRTETNAEIETETETETETENPEIETDAASKSDQIFQNAVTEDLNADLTNADLTNADLTNTDLTDGIIKVGKGEKVATALENLTSEQVEAAGGSITICLTGPTDDVSDIFLPRNKGLEQVTLTSSDEVDYGIGSKASGTAKPVSFFANGIPFVWEHGQITNLYGGGKDITLDSTSITIRGGKLYGAVSSDKGNIVGGSLASKKGVDVSISGDSSIRIEDVDKFILSSMYAGCYTDAGDVTASIGSTHIIIDDSKLDVAIMAGGSYIWGAPAKNVKLDLKSSNIEITDSTITNGYMDFTFSIYGGHMGNDEVQDVTMNCDSVDISVTDSEIIPKYGDGGGEIFGGSYNIKGNRENTDIVTMGDISIELKNSKVNGVWGGGSYENSSSVETGSVTIAADNCTFNASSVIDVPVVCGGDLYFNKDMYPIPTMEKTSVTLTGNTKVTKTDALMISAEGLADDMPKGEMGFIYPEESHLILDEKTASQLVQAESILTADSKWTDITMQFDSQRTAVIDSYEDYEKLIEQMKSKIIWDNVYDSISDHTPGTVENNVNTNEVETPDLPAGVELSEKEIEKQKEAALKDTIAQLSKAASENKDTGLKEVVQDLSGLFEDIKAGDVISLYLNTELNDVHLQAKKTGAGTVLVPWKITLDIRPMASLKPSDGKDEISKVISNTSLNGEVIKFEVGIPASVTEKYVNVTHHISAEKSEEFQTEILTAGDGSRYVEISATSFSLFDFEFTDVLEGDTSDSDSDPDQNPTPVSKTEKVSKDRPGKWNRDEKGWYYEAGYNNRLRSGWNYLYFNGAYKWYCFDVSGYMVTGWYTDRDGSRYYLWPFSDGHQGMMCTGWQEIGGISYYFNENKGSEEGKLLVNTKTPDGHRVDQYGARITVK